MTTTDDGHSIPVPGSSLHEQAVILAGALAESGIPTLVLFGVPGRSGEGSNRSDLACRGTDLPALLCTLGTGDRIEAESVGVTVTRRGGSLIARTATREQRETLALRLSGRFPA